jgi:heat shock protein HslJ
MKTFIFILPLFLFLQCKSTKNVENTTEEQPAKATTEMDFYKSSWVWIETTYPNKKIVPREKDKFTIKFDKERLDITTDCNGMSAFYKIENGQMNFTEFVSTRMYCADSQESEFSHMLQMAEKYELSNNNSTLNIILNNEAKMTFENREK